MATQKYSKSYSNPSEIADGAEYRLLISDRDKYVHAPFNFVKIDNISVYDCEIRINGATNNVIYVPMKSTVIANAVNFFDLVLYANGGAIPANEIIILVRKEVE